MSADDIFLFSYFSQKIDFDILCRLSPKCQSLFSGEVRKISSVCCLLNYSNLISFLDEVLFKPQKILKKKKIIFFFFCLI